MEKHIEISILCEIYGKLLTEKQKDAINDYYNNDLSLAEIAENQGVSRQAVRNLIKSGEEKLLEYENALKLLKTKQQSQKILKRILSKIDKISETIQNDEHKQTINQIKKELSKIIV